MTSLDERLREDHHTLDALCEDIVNRVQSGDTAILDAGWSDLDAMLVEHMDFEERSLLPRFDAMDPEESARLRDEHADIRRRHAQLGVDIEIHAIREDTVREFLAALRAHAAREDRLFHPWVAGLRLDEAARGPSRAARHAAG